MTKPYVPSNLRELLRGDKEGYRLAMAYSLELEHGLMGHFPAIFRGTKRIVVTLDLGLMRRVLLMLPPRRFKMHCTLFYVNPELGIAFPMLGPAGLDLEESKPQQLLDEDEFSRLVARNRHPFDWASGLLDLTPEPTDDEFLRMIEVTSGQYREELT